MYGRLVPGDIIRPNRWDNEPYTVQKIVQSMVAGELDVHLVGADGTKHVIQVIYPERVEVLS